MNQLDGGVSRQPKSASPTRLVSRVKRAIGGLADLGGADMAPLREAVLGTPRFSAQVDQLAQQLSQDREEIRRRADGCLGEMIAAQQERAIRAFDLLFSPFHAKAWTFDVDRAELTRLRELNREQALVFLPSHRSYSDPIVLGTLLRTHQLTRNYVIGGNNMSFFPLGPIARRSGIVFIRRSFKDDEVYKLVLREYMGYLVANKCNLEWYLEGGRSRTGKLRPPRYGILQYLVEAVESGAAAEVLLVPTSITYEQLPEVALMAAEEGGAAKRREDLRWLANYMRAQQTSLGKVYIRFDEPLPLRKALADGMFGANRRWAVQKVAFEICQRINRATPVTAPALVTLALLGVRDRALTLEEVRELASPLYDYALQCGLPVKQLEELTRNSGVEDVLRRLGERGVVHRYAGGLDAVYAIETGQHRVAAFYRNSALHWFVNRAILELALLEPDPPSQKERGKYPGPWMAALALRDLFKFEFFFSDKTRFKDEMKKEAGLLEPAWQTGRSPASTLKRALRPAWRSRFATAKGRQAALAQAPFLVAHRALSVYVEAYYLVADRLAAQEPDSRIDKADLVDQCLAVGQQYLMQKRLYNPECLSKELFGNALLLADNRGLLEPEPGSDNLAARRRVFRRELSAATRAVATIARIDQDRNPSDQESAA